MEKERFILNFAVDEDLLKRLDDYRFEHRLMSRSEALRRLLEEALIYAEAKLGELLKGIPDGLPKKTVGGSLQITTGTLPPGITKQLSHQAQTIANHIDAAIKILDEARQGERRIKRGSLKKTTSSLPPGMWYHPPLWEFSRPGASWRAPHGGFSPFSSPRAP